MNLRSISACSADETKKEKEKNNEKLIIWIDSPRQVLLAKQGDADNTPNAQRRSNCDILVVRKSLTVAHISPQLENIGGALFLRFLLASHVPFITYWLGKGIVVLRRYFARALLNEKGFVLIARVGGNPTIVHYFYIVNLILKVLCKFLLCKRRGRTFQRNKRKEEQHEAGL
jgi:hypothetical protein